MPGDDDLDAVMRDIDADLAARAVVQPPAPKRRGRPPKLRPAEAKPATPKHMPRRMGRPSQELMALREAAGDLTKMQTEAVAALKAEVARLRAEVAAMQSRSKRVAPTPQGGRPKAEIDLGRLKELAALGLSIRHAAPLLNIGARTLDQHLADDPAVREAWDSGQAEAVEKHARRLEALAESGDLGAIIFFLKTRGGFNVPREPQAPPTVTVNLGSQPASVTSAHAYHLLAEQRRYLERAMIDGRAEPVAETETAGSDAPDPAA